MVPMDAYHILLGRPWQYNRHVLYGKKITLIPQSSSSSVASHSSLASFHSMVKILHSEHHEFKESRDMILCSHDDDSPSPKHDHPLLVPLVEQFLHVFPKEIPPAYHQEGTSNTK